MPRGPDAVRVRRLMSEMEMWLFDHAVNESRRAARGTRHQRAVAVGRGRRR